MVGQREPQGLPTSQEARLRMLAIDPTPSSHGQSMRRAP